MSEGGKKIECSVHGASQGTFLCRHLEKGKKLGFHIGYDPDRPDELYPDAWCDLCDKVLGEEGEWNDRSEAFADIKIVCAQCYCEIRESSWKQDDDALHDLICTSFEYLKGCQDSFMATYRVNEHERWDWYQETGKLIFSNQGKPVLECDIDFVGTFSGRSNTWMWAWANASLCDNIKEKSRVVRELGEKEHFMKLMTGIWPADPVDGWEMAAVMAKELGSIGAYRTADEGGLVYMVIGKACWVDR